MMRKIIKRKDLKEKLLQWQQGEITAHELNDWAGENYPNDEIEYEDWDDAESNSVTNEVLAALDMMDMNLMTPEDVPAFLNFLETDPVSFEDGYEKLQSYLKQIDIKKRSAVLAVDPFYERFCL
jgi:23S rRNA A2030 N6-methylase RlmJ